MATANYELRFLKAGIEVLESYLLSKDVYRSIGVRAKDGEPPYPQLTLGWLLLSDIRAQVANLSSAQRSELERLHIQLETTRARWQSAWRSKAQAEFRARLRLWRDFLEEYLLNPQGNFDRYPYEVSRRVMLELLRIESRQISEAEADVLTGLDATLQAVLVSGEFIWDEALVSSFPRSTYWYLYGSLQEYRTAQIK
jgi:hypothetical protein